ncbi:DUF3558 family protein [Tsukamurella sp. 8F]|uniref:DUF3558 family protein n=1 Tax=unclassified Tsukamurella TaxID=2633480 RepID=UPI0023B91117|nr:MULTISPECIES: DUF3558 family protein [unclassified Tsukamurella]MDF0530833.1 DUF3558 family protein [Tsukamurella sp. 8J]MDF0588222.1 DUF3558 family protein [Tsukamurella sp. 8F]
MKQLAVVVLAAAIVTSACATTVAGVAVTPSESRTRIAHPSLPFTPTYTERWNRRNDGSSFEPCTAHIADDLEAIGIDASTMEDAAISDSPNYRGCNWELMRRPGDSPGTALNYATQAVSNQRNLPFYKEGHDEMRWGPDQVIDGRVFGVADAPHDDFLVAFESGTALVITSVKIDRRSHRSPSEERERAMKFALLAATKAPR